MNKLKKAMSSLLISGLAVGGYFAGNALVRDVRYARAEEQVAASREDLKKVDDIYGVYRAVGKAVEPSVVSIEVRKTVKGVHGGLRFDDDMLRRFFQQDPDNAMPNLPRNRGPYRNAPNNPNNPDNNNDGSDDNNNDSFEQVAGGAESMTITLSDGRKIKKAKVLGTDPKSDLAVVQIEADKLIPAKWGDSDTLEKGDVIFAFGSPFGYIGSMTHGIVSALNRTEIGIVGRQGGFAYENFIQVDAPINPGNSGGPLVNLHGEVVGINTAIATETGAFNGIGFAIPSNQAHPVYDQLKENGKVVRGYIGVKIGSVADNPDLAKTFGYEKDNGVLVVETFPGTPATGKLHKGDIVTAINGKTVKDSTQLRNTVATIKPGEEATFTIFHRGKSEDVKLKIGEQPESLASSRTPSSSGGETGNGEAPSADTSAKSLGLHLATPSEELLARFNLEEGVKGAIVTNVDRRSAAFRAGIRPGDVITEVGDTAIESARQATEALAKQDLSKGIRVTIVNQQGSNFALLKDEEK